MNDKVSHARAWLAKANSELTPFAVESRYDMEFWPEAAEASSAVTTAAEVCLLVSRILSA